MTPAMTLRRETRSLFVAAVLCTAAPAFAHWHLGERITGELEPALARSLGVPVAIADLEAGPTGEARIYDLRLGALVSAERIEAGVSLPRLLTGTASADEITVIGPRVRARVGAGRERALLDLIERARSLCERTRNRERAGTDTAGKAGAAAQDSARLVRRVIARDGELTIELPGDGGLPAGEIRMTGIALHPHVGGARAVSERIAFDLSYGPWSVAGQLGRASFDLAPSLTEIPRFLAVDGTAELYADGAEPLSLRGLTVGRGISDSGFLVSGEALGTAKQGQEPGRAHVRVWQGPEGTRIRAVAHDLMLAPLAPALPRSLDVAAARSRGQADIALGPGVARIVAQVSVSELRMDDRRVAEDSVELSGQIALAAESHRRGGQSELHISQLTLTRGALGVALSGALLYSGRRSWIPDRGELTLRIPEVGCQEALAAVPEGLRPALKGMVLAGALSAGGQIVFDRDGLKQTEIDLSLDTFGCEVVSDADAADPRALIAAFAHRRPDGTIAMLGAGQPDYVTLAALPRHVSQAFISSEDAQFFRHKGFDLGQIESSLAKNLRSGAFVRGGSTISQQLVKNVFLSHRRTVGRKLQEAILTWRLEAVLRKEQILERYLNVIELGPGVFGVGQAARYWFGKDARALTVRESAFLAALTPAPRTLSRRLHSRGSVDDELERRIHNVLAAMRWGGVISAAEQRRAERRDMRWRRDLWAMPAESGHAGPAWARR